MRMEETQTKIINTYKKVSRFFFHYLIFFVALIVGFFVFQGVLSKSVNIEIFQENDNLLMQKMKLIAEFSKFMKQNIKDNDLEIHILHGDLQTEEGFIKSVNNLISYKWFIVPRYFYFYSTLPIKNISYFSGWAYALDELENFVNTFVFTKKITVNKPFTRVQLPLEWSLRENFNLSCIFENKISRKTCNYYLDDFLDNFFIYMVAKDYAGLWEIFNVIKNNENTKEKFCKWLSNYLLYSNDQSKDIENLFDACGTTYTNIFKRTILFMEIQNTLENQSFEETSYKDKTLNAYKLLSYQQQLYQDFLVNKADTYKISAYLDFVREILKKNAIDPFYKDEIYRYNNKYLALSLEKSAHQTTLFTQNLGGNKIASLLTTISILNEGEMLLGFSWLQYEVTNTTLITQHENITWTITTMSIEERIQKKLQGISYMTIEKKSVSDSTIDIVWYLKFFSPDKNETIKTHIIMTYENDMLLVKSIELQNRPEINDVIKNLLLIQSFSIGELYSYISKNLIFYEQENFSLSIESNLCSDLGILKNISLISCTNSEVIIEKNTVRYVFTLKDGRLENVTTSDIALENAIKTSYSEIIWNTYSLDEAIKEILNYEAPEKIYEGTTNAIVVFEKIQHYLWIKANDIADKEGKILVDFTLGAINFIVYYTLETNTLGPRYFKDIIAGGKPYLIQNLNLPLDDAHQNSINSFVIDPLTAIKNADFTAWQNYNERLKQSTNN